MAQRLRHCPEGKVPIDVGVDAAIVSSVADIAEEEASDLTTTTRIRRLQNCVSPSPGESVRASNRRKLECRVEALLSRVGRRSKWP